MHIYYRNVSLPFVTFCSKRSNHFAGFLGQKCVVLCVQQWKLFISLVFHFLVIVEIIAVIFGQIGLNFLQTARKQDLSRLSNFPSHRCVA